MLPIFLSENKYGRFNKTYCDNVSITDSTMSNSLSDNSNMSHVAVTSTCDIFVLKPMRQRLISYHLNQLSLLRNWQVDANFYNGGTIVGTCGSHNCAGGYMEPLTKHDDDPRLWTQDGVSVAVQDN